MSVCVSEIQEKGEQCVCVERGCNVFRTGLANHCYQRDLPDEL